MMRICLFAKLLFLDGHLSRDVDDRAEDSLYRAADAANNRLQQRTQVSHKCQVMIYDP